MCRHAWLYYAGASLNVRCALTVHSDDVRTGHAVDAGVRLLRPARLLPVQHGRHLPHHRRSDGDASEYQPAVRGREAIR